MGEGRMDGWMDGGDKDACFEEVNGCNARPGWGGGGSKAIGASRDPGRRRTVKSCRREIGANFGEP